ncbi:MAG: RagB/SusD family nutrient uptake outer membrane protein [Janthinobacterium lividum]
MKFSQSRGLAKWLLSASLLTASSACNVLNQDPPTNLSVNDSFSTAARISSSLIGVYNDLQQAEFLGGRALIYSDIRSGDTDVPTYFGNVGRFQMLSTDAFASNAWYGGYRTIFGANSFLQNLADNTGKLTAAQERQYIAECKFIRALTMWHLVNLFAQPYNFTADASHPGIVIQLTAPRTATDAFDPTQRLPRSSVAAVYTQMEKDLREAIPDLPVVSGTRSINNVGRATKGAGQALLARVFLYKGDYTQAADFAGQVITAGNYALNAGDPRLAFYNFTTNESIFSVAMNANDNPNTNNAIGQHYGPDRRADITITPFSNATTLSATDKRRTTLFDIRGANVFTAKFYSVDNWVPIVRYPEVLLTRAEALAQNSTTPSAEAITLLNQVRSRSTTAYDATSFTTKQGLIDAILEERRLELAFEGFRLYDLLRYKRNIPAHGTVPQIAYNSNFVIFPIPYTDTQLNPSLTQNPGY